MALFALCTGIIFFADDPLVNILVTIAAMCADIPEAPFIALFMAGNTGCRKVAAFKFEGSLVVLFNGIGRSREPVHGVTRCTIGCNPVRCKLTCVIIGMTIGTMREFHCIGEPCLVAFPAIDRLMLSFQPEIGPVVVEIVDRPDRCEPRFSVALGAVRSEFVRMRILVAIVATSVFNTLEFLELLSVQGGDLVATQAWHLLVLPGKPESRPFMVEFLCRFKGIEIMTVAAGGGKCLLVIILVAGQTFGVQPKVGECLFTDLGILDEIFLMAINALLLGMFPG
jgi:hypothetical protein